MKIPSGNPNSILPFSPRKLISLWDMNQIVAEKFLSGRISIFRGVAMS